MVQIVATRSFLFAKVFLNRVINHGNYTNVKASLIGHSNGMCKSCTNKEEIPDHLFCTCSFAKRCWADLTGTISDASSRLSLKTTASFLDLLDSCLHTSPVHTICLSVFFETVWYIWKQKNGDTYQGNNRIFIPIIPITKMLHLMEAILAASKRK